MSGRADRPLEELISFRTASGSWFYRSHRSLSRNVPGTISVTSGALQLCPLPLSMLAGLLRAECRPPRAQGALCSPESSHAQWRMSSLVCWAATFQKSQGEAPEKLQVSGKSQEGSRKAADVWEKMSHCFTTPGARLEAQRFTLLPWLALSLQGRAPFYINSCPRSHWQ